MSAEATSVRSYYDAIAEGWIGEKQHFVLKQVIMMDDGDGVSQGEVTRVANDTARSISPRFRELVYNGLIEQCGFKMDPVTNRTVKAYQATGKAIEGKLEPVPRVRKAVCCPHCNYAFTVSVS